MLASLCIVGLLSFAGCNNSTYRFNYIRNTDSSIKTYAGTINDLSYLSLELFMIDDDYEYKILIFELYYGRHYGQYLVDDYYIDFDTGEKINKKDKIDNSIQSIPLKALIEAYPELKKDTYSPQDIMDILNFVRELEYVDTGSYSPGLKTTP